MEDYIEDIFSRQRRYFDGGNTLSYEFRLSKLKVLKALLLENEEEIYGALKKDLNKDRLDSYTSEFGLLISAINHGIKNLKKWMKRKKVRSPLSNFPSKSYIIPEPYGLSLIVSPWNYPLLLTIEPLIGSICRGNCTILKPSNYSIETSKLLNKLISKYFNEEYISLIEGGRRENQILFKKKFDYIFFTGSPSLGRIVMENASKNLTPITLELGGKSPCIVDDSADIDLSSKRITWGKMMNGGQTCVAPDYILCDERIKDDLIGGIGKYLKEFFGDRPIENEAYPKIINDKHFNRLLSYLKELDVEDGPIYDIDKGRLELITITNPSLDSRLMNEEIFGPILPIITYKDFDWALDFIKEREKPLAGYIFSGNRENIEKFIQTTSFGGGCINDCLVHLATNSLPFGGVGNSGMGNYHGKYSFDTFSHYKAIVDRKTYLDINLRYHPSGGKLKWIKKILK